MPDNAPTRAHLAGALRAAWPFTHVGGGRPNLATVCLETTNDGLLLRASYGKALATILVPCKGHGLVHPLRLSRDACKVIAREVCKVKGSTRGDGVTFGDTPTPDDDLLGNRRRVRIQAHGTYGPLTDDHTDVNADPWVPFPDTSDLYLDEEQVFIGNIAARDLALVGAAISQLARAADFDESKLIVRFTTGPGHHEARVEIPGWYDARFTMSAMRLVPAGRSS